MNNKSFFLYVVVTKFWPNSVAISNPKRMVVKLKLNTKEILLTRSSINVNDFKPKASTEFQLAPEKMREVLSRCPVPVVVKCDGALIGEGAISFSPCFIESIDDRMTDVTHPETCEIQRAGKLTGTLDLLFRLDYKEDKDLMMQTVENSNSIDTNIQKQDIAFLVGNSQQRSNTWCKPCLDLLPPLKDDELLQLDLERYKNLNFSNFNPEDLNINNENSPVQPLKDFIQECKEIIDSLNKHSCSPPNSRVRSPTKPYRSEGDYGHHTHYNNYTSPPRSARDRLPAQEFPNFSREDLQRKEMRLCPVCLNNMSWLPKFAACPKCKVKPVPVVDESNMDNEQTIEEILNEYAGKPASIKENTNCSEQTNQKYSRCRCVYLNKPCAHCRIRKMCGEYMPTETDEAPSTEPIQFAVNVDPEDSRPHLTKVFSDLQDLYHMKNVKKRTQFDQHCDENQIKTLNARAKAIGRRPPCVFRNAHHTQPLKNRPRVGHESCASRQRPVPRRHGWAWPSSYEARNFGWRPGAVLKPIQKLRNFFLHTLPSQTAYNVCQQESESKTSLDSKPAILKVRKKDGAIFITLRPRNDRQAPQKPIVFKIVKSDFAVILSEIKRRLKAKGFRKCTCHKSLMLCVCRHYMEKKELEHEMEIECQRFGIESCVNSLVLTDTSESEPEFDFDVNPPMKPAQPWTPQEPQRANAATQYGTDRRPSKTSPFWRAYNCATADQYTNTAFGNPGEAVFEDGVFGYRGGGPHGASATPGDRPKSAYIWGSRPGGPMPGVGISGGVHPGSEVRLGTRSRGNMHPAGGNWGGGHLLGRRLSDERKGGVHLFGKGPSDGRRGAALWFGKGSIGRTGGEQMLSRGGPAGGPSGAKYSDRGDIKKKPGSPQKTGAVRPQGRNRTVFYKNKAFNYCLNC